MPVTGWGIRQRAGPAADPDEHPAAVGLRTG